MGAAILPREVSSHEKSLEGAENARLVQLDCPHYVHDHAYDAIRQEIEQFLCSIPQ